MAHSIEEPGPNGDYPWLPRNADGTIDTRTVPIGIEWRTVNGKREPLRLMPTLANGRPITDIAPLPAGQTVEDALPRKL